MEQNKEMTAQESLKLITETMNNNRMEIVRNGGKYYILWGSLLTFFSLLVYILWKTTGNPAWNDLWFALPVVGFPLARWMKSKKDKDGAENVVSRFIGGIWLAFCAFSVTAALFTVFYGIKGVTDLSGLVLVGSLTAQIVLLFGMALTISGVALKNWAIKIAGFVTGIGGMIIYYLTASNTEQMLIFTFAGIVLAATGLIVKYQYK